jgi:fructose-bisphosphate aldolase, class II
MLALVLHATERFEAAGTPADLLHHKTKRRGAQMQGLQEALVESHQRQAAIGHFNVSDLVMLRAVTESARIANTPVIVGVSEGESDFMGAQQIVALVRSLRTEDGPPIFLNADHTRSLAKATEAAKLGFDMIVCDRSEMSLKENIRETRIVVEAVKAINPSVLVEGELGYIGRSSAIHREQPNDLAPLTTPDEAQEFVAATGVDLLAPAIGNMHGLLPGMVHGSERKRLDIKRTEEIKRATGVPLTLHGGSGTADQDLRQAIRAGINVIHINTELRVAWRRALDSALAQDPAEVVPYKLLRAPLAAVQQVVTRYLQLFAGRQEQAMG